VGSNLNAWDSRFDAVPNKRVKSSDLGVDVVDVEPYNFDRQAAVFANTDNEQSSRGVGEGGYVGQEFLDIAVTTARESLLIFVVPSFGCPALKESLKCLSVDSW
jgi:hypothetical protein